MTLSSQRTTSTMMITPTIPTPPVLLFISISRSVTARPFGRRMCVRRAAAASHRWLGRRVGLASRAISLATGPADVVTEIPEVLADLVPGIADIVLRVRAVDAAGGLLDVVLDVAERPLGFVHRPVSFPAQHRGRDAVRAGYGPRKPDDTRLPGLR